MEAPFGQNVLLKVGSFTPSNDIGEGVVLAIGAWIGDSTALRMGQTVKFRITTQGQPPKANDQVYVKIEDVFAIVAPPEMEPQPAEEPEPLGK